MARAIRRLPRLQLNPYMKGKQSLITLQSANFLMGLPVSARIGCLKILVQTKKTSFRCT